MTAVASNQNVQCPRCGYDLRGAMATWTVLGSCPLKGTCAECGLNFQWIDIIKPDRVPPRWCVEHVPQRGFLKAMLLTIAMAFRPWRFWSRLKMSHEVRPKRLLGFASALFASLVLVAAIAQASAAVYVRIAINEILTTELRAAQALLATADIDLTLPWHEQPDAKVSDFCHVVTHREVQYWQLHAAQQHVDKPPFVDRSLLWCVAEALYVPLASESRAKIVDPRPPLLSFGSKPGTYPGPSKLIPAAIQEFHRVRNRLGPDPDVSGFWLRAKLPLLISMAIPVLLPGSLVLLPLSRKRAKVRWAHIGRVFVYSMAIPFVMLNLAGAVLLWGSLSHSVATGTVLAGMLLIALPVVPIVLWWAAALSRYLHMPHSKSIVLVHTFLSVMVVLACTWLIKPEWVIPGPW